jgi:hypothetical protein
MEFKINDRGTFYLIKYGTTCSWTVACLGISGEKWHVKYQNYVVRLGAKSEVSSQFFGENGGGYTSSKPATGELNSLTRVMKIYE